MLTPVKGAALLLRFQLSSKQPRYGEDNFKGFMVMTIVEHDSALSTLIAMQVQECADAAAMTG